MPPATFSATHCGHLRDDDWCECVQPEGVA